MPGEGILDCAEPQHVDRLRGKGRPSFSIGQREEDFMAQRPPLPHGVCVGAGQSLAERRDGRVRRTPQHSDQLYGVPGRCAIDQRVPDGNRVTRARRVNEVALVQHGILLVDRRVDGGVHGIEVRPIQLRHDVEPRVGEQEAAVREDPVVLDVCADEWQPRSDGGVLAPPVRETRLCAQI